MTNPNQNMNKTENSDKAANAATPANSDKAAKISKEIKATWSKLSDDDVKLYASSRDQFFAKLKEKESVSKDDAEKRLQEIEKTCAAECAEKDKDAKAA